MQQAWAESKEEGTERCLVRGDVRKHGEAILRHSPPEEKQELPPRLSQGGAGSGVYTAAVEQELHSSTERKRVDIVAARVEAPLPIPSAGQGGTYRSPGQEERL